ncbi:MAG: indole-3-glycerol phosphate synthase TrpC [Elusimicrobiota bacterium]|jgi:indole-3-glycerol phosphate synthase
MSDFLNHITEETQKRVDALKLSHPLSSLRQRDRSDPVRSFGTSLWRSRGVSLIAELKQASPSAGLIRKENDIEGRLKAYEKGGASALSILTEESYFHGSPQLLEVARLATRLPLLRKDFIVDPYQIPESRSLGADAILLIVAILSGSRLKDFLQATQEAGLDALVEVHDEQELDQALLAGATLLGINNRNLHTLEVDLQTTARLIPRIPSKGCTIVVESGIQAPDDLKRIRDWRAQAVLIGETLMRDPHPEDLVRRFVEVGQS